MADTPRTRLALLALMADNTTGAISAQDFRDFMVTLMPPDFANPGDFWTQPRSGPSAFATVMTDKTVQGWVEYSQLMLESVSFGKVCYLTPSGWAPATASMSTTTNGVLGVAANSYLTAESQAQILRRGLIMDTALSVRFTGNIGKFLYLQSGASLGSISITIAGSVHTLGYVELSAWSDTSSSKWRFDPTWGVTA